MATIEGTEVTGIKYIFVSDIEGCETHGRFGDMAPQNTTMCDTPFYEALDKELSKGTHVCFLGDYFDHGPGVLNSVVQIAKLKLKHGDKVHIILGNRDVNKFRIYFEKDFIFKGNNTKYGIPIGPFGSHKQTDNAIGDSTTNMRQWMADTMGINNDANRNGLICGFKDDKDAHDGTVEKSAETVALEAFKYAFSPENFSDETDDSEKEKLEELEGLNLDSYESDVNFNAFSAAVNVIYKQGNLVEYIQNSELLLSHAGGVHARMVIAPEKVAEEVEDKFKPWWDKMIDGDDDEDEEENYYKTLLANKTVNMKTNDAIKSETITSSTDTFTDIVNSYRELYANFLDLFERGSNPYTLLQYHYLIQGFGLEGGFIGSCGHTRHMPPKQPATFDEIKLLEDYPKYSAFGHVNYGLEYPIIYKRGKRVMIACDTSVGYRPRQIPFYMNMLDLSKSDHTKYGILSYTATLTPSLTEHPYNMALKEAMAPVIEISNAITPAKDAITTEIITDNTGGKRTTQKRHSKKSKKKKVHRKKTRKNRKTKRTKR